MRLAVDTTMLEDAEPYGEFLTHSKGHYDVWEHWKSLGSSKLKRLQLPMSIVSSEYDATPRGRLVFDTKRDLYVIYADRKLQQASTIENIIILFGLVGKK